MKGLLYKELMDEYSNKQEFECYEPKVLRSHLRKTIIQYTVRLNHFSTKTYIGLHRDSDKRFEHVFSILQLLRASGFNEESDLRVPKPILYLPSLSFLLMEEAEGILLGTFFAQQEQEKTHLKLYTEGAAKWLAKLHNSSITTNRISSSGERDGIAATLKFRIGLLNLFPTLSKKIDSISERMIRMQKEEEEEEEFQQYNNKARLVHGDYHPKNIFASSNSITVIDFEESRMGDPAFDLGYFVAQIKMSYGFKAAVIEAADIFLQKYIQESQLCSHHSNLEKRQKIYEAQTYLQRIYHTYWLLKLKPDIDLVSKWLTESEICLEKADGRMP